MVDKLVITQAGRLSQDRLARSLKLNHAEATVRAFMEFLHVVGLQS